LTIKHLTLSGVKVIVSVEQARFVREYNRVDGVTQPYLFLGTARYLSHEGSRPMSITWKLDRPMPPGFFLKANKMVVG